MNECPKCKSDKTIKSAHYHGKQRYRCKSCGFQFTRTTPRGHPASEKALVVTLYTMGLSLNSIAKLLKVSTPEVAYFKTKVAQWPLREITEGKIISLPDLGESPSWSLNHSTWSI